MPPQRLTRFWSAAVVTATAAVQNVVRRRCEVFFGIGDEVPKRLAEARESAREKRMKENRAVRCGVCVGDDDFGGVAIATAAVQNVVGRSWDEFYLQQRKEGAPVSQNQPSRLRLDVVVPELSQSRFAFP